MRRLVDHLRAPATLTIIAIVCVAFVGQQVSGIWMGNITHLRRALGFSAHDIATGQWWRVVTPNLTNGPNPFDFGPPGLPHLLTNVIGLVGVGPLVERKLGWLRYVAIAVVSGAIAYGWLMVPLPRAAYPDGTSGLLYGVLGVLVAMTITEPPQTKRGWAARGVIFVLALGGIVGQPLITGEIHLGGLVSGFVLGLVFVVSRRASSAIGATGATVAVLLATVAVRSAQLFGR